MLVTLVALFVVSIVAFAVYELGELRKERIARDDVRNAVLLLAAWSQGDAEQTDRGNQTLALLTVKRMREHAEAGTLPVDDVEEPVLNMQTAALAWGQPLMPVPRDMTEADFAPPTRDPEEDEDGEGEDE